MESGVMKTSAVLVASGGSRSVYASLREVPEPLRTQVIASTSGRNAGTILIADRRGKEEIEKAARSGGYVLTQDASQAWAEPAWRRAWPIAVALLIVAVGAAAVFFARA
jgi:hypothetical protein